MYRRGVKRMMTPVGMRGMQMFRYGLHGARRAGKFSARVDRLPFGAAGSGARA